MKIIVVSAINFRMGGPLSILNDCLYFLSEELSSSFRIIVLVHKKSLVYQSDKLEYIEFPKSIHSYLYRIYYEYYFFKKISVQLKPYLWISLHDMSPNIQADIKAVYCHNPAPFYKVSLKELYLDPKFYLFNLLYEYIYKINIKKNDFVIVQQAWLRQKFIEKFHIKNVIVSYPEIKYDGIENSQIKIAKEKDYLFFFPTLPRVFKNIEIVCDAIKILNTKQLPKFKVAITIDGSENKYSQYIYSSYHELKELALIGKLSRKDVFEMYKKSDCLIFPSKLETWGLPITEFKNFNKPMLVGDLEYARETVGDYKKVKFFNAYDAKSLANEMEAILMGRLLFDDTHENFIEAPFAKTWRELFAILLYYKI